MSRTPKEFEEIDNFLAIVKSLSSSTLRELLDKFIGLTYYQILGVSENVTNAQIEENFREKYQEYISKRERTDGEWSITIAAYNRLRNPVERMAYDKELHILPTNNVGKMSDFKPVFGIDLGTTYSAIAYIDEHDKPVVIMNQDNKPITASVVHFYDKDNFVVGDEAVNMLKADPQNTVSFIKRNMGDLGFKLAIHGKDYSPQEISALILKQLAKDAQNFFMQKGIDVEVKDVVITVPAYFGMEQKGATKEAGELAGLNVLRIMNEPSAAALAFGINKLGKDQNVFVFDLGGGTFDVTILNIKGNEINMVASDGDPELGGKEWDDALLGYCADLFKTKYGADPQDDPYSFQELYGRVVSAKLSLSKKPKTKIVVTHAGNSEYFDISREIFEELSKDLLSRCRSLCESVLKRANMTWSDIDSVLMVGGSTWGGENHPYTWDKNHPTFVLKY